jgi:hypothetical protein
LSAEQKKKLAATARKDPLSTITGIVTSPATRKRVLKIVGGACGAIIAPLLVLYWIGYLEKKDTPPAPPDANAILPSPLVGEGPGVRGRAGHRSNQRKTASVFILRTLAAD